MLTDLLWLNKGEIFPPKDEHQRLEMYEKNKLIFESDREDVYTEYQARLNDLISTGHNPFPMVLNFQQKISVKTTDFMFSEKPVITVEDKAKQKVVDAIITRSHLFRNAKKALIDWSRYGTGVFKIVRDETGRGKIATMSPRQLFIIVDEGDIQQTRAHVVAWTEGQGKDRTLKVHVHREGTRDEITLKLKKDTYIIEGTAEKKKTFQTGLPKSAIIPMHNTLTTDRVWGIDDYTIIDTIIPEIETRKAQMSKIMDKLSDPVMNGDASALAQDVNGEYTLIGGNFYNCGPDGRKLEYTVWDASMTAQKEHIQGLYADLAILSEMGAALFDDDYKKGNVMSGEALKKLYIAVLAKVGRAKEEFEPGIKRAISLASIYDGVKIAEDEINIKWGDGLPEDNLQKAQIAATRAGNVRTKSTKRILMDVDGMSEEAATEGAEEIAEEQSSEMSGMFPAVPNTDVDDGNDDE